MILIERNFYVIKQSNGTLWNFAYDENKGIIYRFLKENTWSDYQVITNKGVKNFSVVLLWNDNICVLFQDTRGNINLSKYDKKGWNEQQILQNEKSDIFHIYFKAIATKNQIHIVYNVLNKKTAFGTLFHQALDEKNNLSNPKIIDTIKFDYQVPFDLFTADNKEIFIMYQRVMDNHQIGYKIFNKESENWSNFYVIDTCMYPYKDYSMLMSKDNLHVLYIKHEQNKNILIYAYGNHINFKYNKLWENPNIDSCIFFIAYNQVWCSWIQDNKIYSSFSIDNGNNFSMPPHHKLLTSQNIIKSIYRFNNNEDIKDSIVNEIYVINRGLLKYLVISDIYTNIDNNNNNDSSYIVYFMNKIYERILMYEKNFKQEGQFIARFKNMIKEEKIKSLYYEKKFEEENKAYTNFKEGKQMLNENINFLQENLIAKEEKINILENIHIEKENELSYLKEKISQEENKSLSLIKEIEELKDQIEDLNSQLALANSKLNKSFFKRIFNND